MGWKHKAYHIINSDPGHMRSKQQLDKYWKITFASPSKILFRRRKRKRNAIAKPYTLKRKRKKQNILRIISIEHKVVTFLG